MKSALRIGALMFLQWAIYAANTKCLQWNFYPGVIVSDLAYAYVGFTLIQSVAEAETRAEKVMYALGGAAGSSVGLFLTNYLHG